MTITDVQSPGLPPDGEDGPRRRAWRRWFRRAEGEAPGTDVTTWSGDETTEPEGWAWVERHALQLPDRRHLKRRIRHAAPKMPGIFLRVVAIRIPVTMWREVVGPVWRGAGKCIVSYTHWVTASKLNDAHKVAEGAAKAKPLIEQHKSHGYRVWTSIIGAGILTGGAFYLYYDHLMAFAGTIIIILCILDLIGRQDMPTKEFAPVYREPWSDGMSYRQLTETLQAAFNEIVGVDSSNGFPLVRMDGICTYDFARQEWRQLLSTHQEIDADKHIRALERSVGWRVRSMRLLEVPEVATRRILIIKDGDPLADVPSAPEVPTGSRSITQPAPLGKSKDIDHPFSIGIAGVHVIIVAKTGGGKTVHFDNLIDYVSTCYDAIPWGINIVKRHAFSKWRGVIQRVARTPEEAQALLTAALVEIQRRMDILDERANSDDPAVHTERWDPSDPEMGPALVIFIDEFPQIAAFNGQPKDTLDLLHLVETVHRIGREVMVSMVIALQKWGNKDAGSTVVSSQSSVIICGPCFPDDAGEIFGYKMRDAGWAPHLLEPANDYAINDAGKAFVKAPGFGPDEVRGWAPRPTGKVIQIANQRVADGLPSLPEGAEEIIEGTTVPNTLAALQQAFEEIGPEDGRLPSEMAAKWISDHSSKTITATQLAAQLKKELKGKALAPRRGRSVLGGNGAYYDGDDIQAAMEALDG